MRTERGLHRRNLLRVGAAYALAAGYCWMMFAVFGQ